VGVWAVAWVVSKVEEDTTTTRFAGSLGRTLFPVLYVLAFKKLPVRIGN